MWFRVLADTVLVIHLAFVAFVLFGGMIVLRWPRFAWLHLPAAFWGVFIEFSGRICPLTPLENWLRVRGGERGYSGGFVDHYLTSLIYPDGLTRAMQVGIGLFVFAFNVFVYWRVLRRSQQDHSAASSQIKSLQ